MSINTNVISELIKMLAFLVSEKGKSEIVSYRYLCNLKNQFGM